MRSASSVAASSALALALSCGGEYWRINPPEVDSRLHVALPKLVDQELPSTMTVISSNNADAGLLQMTLVLRGGYGEDPPGKEGLARIAAAVLALVASSPSNAVRFGLLGATPEIEVTRGGLTVAIEVLPADGPAAARALADFITEAAPVAAALDRARAVRRAALGRVLGSPDVLASIAIARVFAPAKGTSRSLGLGTEASLAAMTTDDVGQYFERALDPRETAFIVTGPVKPQQAEAWALAAFGSWPRRPARPRPSNVGRVRSDVARVVFIPMSGMKQTLIVVGGLRPVIGDPDSVAFAAALAILMGRMHYSLREDLRVSYGIGDGVDTEDDVFVVPIRVRADKTRVALDAIQALLAPVHTAVSAEWIRQRRVSQSVRLMDESQYSAKMAAHACDVFLNSLHIASLERTLDAVQQLDGAAVEESTAFYLQPRSLRIVVVGDPEVARPQLRRDFEEWAPATLLEVGPI